MEVNDFRDKIFTPLNNHMKQKYGAEFKMQRKNHYTKKSGEKFVYRHIICAQKIVSKQSTLLCSETNTDIHSNTLKTGLRTKKVCACDAKLSYMYNPNTKKWSISKNTSLHTGHSFSLRIATTLTPEQTKDIRKRLNEDRQSTSSILKAYEREYNVKFTLK